MPQAIAPFLAPIFGKVGATVAANLLISVSLTALSTALNKPKGADQASEVAIPKSLPPYRFGYGRAVRTQGSPAPGWVTNNGVLYQCIILNSRPSDGANFKVFIDKREVELDAGHRNFGNVAQGTVTIAEGQTEAVVTHGLPVAPTRSGASYAFAAVPVSEVGATTLKVTLPDPAPEGGAEVYWSAWVSSNTGADATEDPFYGHFTCWLGLGDQGHPPAQILDEWGDATGLDTRRFWASDKWTDRTVLWVRAVSGDQKTRQERWPSYPNPEIEIEMDWSKVCDPRDPAQDPDDPSTWEVSDNQALCLLDALRFNPLARHPMSALWLETFIHAANVADEEVPIKAGGVDPRYRVGGLLVFSGASELLEQLQPLSQAGGGSIIKVGGKVGYRAGEYQDPVVTLTDYLRGPMRFQSTRRSRELPNAVKAVFPDPASQWEAGELIPYQVRADWDGGPDRVEVLDMPLVPYARQAMRLQKIAGERLKAGKSFSATFPPDAVRLVAGAPAAVALPGTDRRNGVYQVSQMHPAQFLEQDEGVALAMPMDLTEDGPQIWAWEPGDDEQDRIEPDFEAIDLSMPAPSDVQGDVSGSNIDWSFLSPGSVQTIVERPNPDDRIEYDAFVIPADIVSFGWGWRANQGDWQSGTAIDRDAVHTNPGDPNTGRAGGQISGVSSGNSYEIRVQSLGDGRSSAYAYSEVIQFGFTLTAPTGVSATGGAGQITINATSPDDADHHALQYWRAFVDNPAAATLIAEHVVAQNTADSHAETGLGPNVTRYYFVRAVTSTGAVGPFAPVASATTDP